MPCLPIPSAPASPVKADLHLPADLSRLPELASFAKEQACRAHMGEKAAGRLRLILEELFTNVCAHGNEGSDKGEAHRVDIHCELRAQDKLLHSTFSDTAPPFNPLARPSPVGPLLPLEDLPIGGQGLHLVRSMTVEALYTRTEDRNIFTFSLALV